MSVARHSGGIRQRLAKSRAAAVPVQPLSAAIPVSAKSSVPGPRKGIKQKVLAAASSGPDQKVQKLTTDVEDAPLNSALIGEWSRGKLTSQQVLQFAFKAARQGASGIGKLDKNPGPQNACRALISALPKDVGAPDIDFIGVPGPDGKTRPHPILCPMSCMDYICVIYIYI
jgi:hypothetical protein